MEKRVVKKIKKRERKEPERDFHRIGVIPGDLNGITVTNSALEVNGAAHEAGLMRKVVRQTEIPYSADWFLEKEKEKLEQEDLDKLRTYDALYLGAIGDPTKIDPGVLEKGILLEIRQKFDQAINLRPVILHEGVPSILVGKDYRHINFEICRENTEGLYVRIGWIENEGTEDEAGYNLMKCTYKAVKRLADFAFERAKLRKRFEKPRIHFVFKTNVLTESGSPWTRVFKEYEAKTELVDVVYMHFDNFLMQMVSEPEQLDEVVMENFMGDGASDLGAKMQGGIGIAGAGNLNLTGEYPSLFEPIHGTAPDKWYEKDANGKYIPGTFKPDLVQRVRPEGAILSWAMMLEHLGEKKAARVIEEAARANIRDPKYQERTLDELTAQACRYVKRVAA